MGTTFYNREKLPAINHLVLNTLIMLLLKTTLLVPQTKLPSNWGRSWRRLYRRRHFLFGSTFCCLDQSGLTQIKRQLPMSLILWLTSFTFSTPTASMLLLSLLLVRWSMSLLEEFFVKLLPARLNSFVKIQINHKPFPFSCLSTYNEWTLVFHSSIEKSFFFEGKRVDLFSRKIKKKSDFILKTQGCFDINWISDWSTIIVGHGFAAVTWINLRRTLKPWRKKKKMKKIPSPISS